MSISVVLTINDRPLDTVADVLYSLDGQGQAETIVVLDGTPKELKEQVETQLATGEFGKVVIPEIVRASGWLSPVRAMNMGFAHAKGDLLYILSSDVIQSSRNVLTAAKLVDGYGKPVVLFGRAECSCGPTGREVVWPDGAPGNLLVSADHPRPLGFIYCLPRATMEMVGGFNERFAEGYWYDDDDLVRRLWDSGADFLFDDTVSGVHQHHERPVLELPHGQAGILKNQAYMLEKWGDTAPIHRVPKLVRSLPGRTIWSHP